MWQDCSVDITPISLAACSEPGSTAYTYDRLKITGYYTSTTQITTLMPTVANGHSRQAEGTGTVPGDRAWVAEGST